MGDRQIFMDGEEAVIDEVAEAISVVSRSYMYKKLEEGVDPQDILKGVIRGIALSLVRWMQAAEAVKILGEEQSQVEDCETPLTKFITDQLTESLSDILD